MKILGLDCAGSTGWALYNGTEIASGVWDIRHRTGESPGMRYIRLRGRLNEILAACPGLSLVAVEKAHMRGAAATQYAHGYLAVIQAFCSEHQLEHVGFHTGTLKKFATGKGNASKPEMIAEAGRRYGLTTSGKAREDEADALWVLALARTKYESPQFEGTVQFTTGGADADSEGQERGGESLERPEAKKPRAKTPRRAPRH